jgi:hypothetical protein
LQAKYEAVVGVVEKENKHIRIISFLKKNWNRLYFAHDCQTDYLSQILDYEEGLEPDDAPDSAAGLIREMKLDHNFEAELYNRFEIRL